MVSLVFSNVCTSSPSADVQQLLVTKEEAYPEQQEWSSSLDQEDPPETPCIEKEQKELWASQEGEQLQRLEEADNAMFTPEVKSEDDDGDKAQSSQLHHRQTEEERDVEVEAGGSDPDKTLNPGTCLQPGHDKTSQDSESETDDSSFYSEEIREPQSGLNLLHNKVPASDLEHKTEKTPALSSESAARADHKRHPQEHSEIQKGEKPFGCSVCGKRYHQGKLLIIHSKLHSKEKRHFKRSGDVGCTEEKPFSCSLCGKRFEKSYNLIAHVRVHTGEKPFTCSVCKTCFKTRHALMNHMRIHTGEKPFRCSVCGKRFVQSGSLKQHTSVHTEEKPYSCNACDKRFSLLTYLRRHKCVSKFSSKRRSCRNAC